MAGKKEMNDQEAAQALIKAVYDDKEMELNGGRKYKFLTMTHKQRRKVFAFMSRIQNLIQAKDFSFMEWPEFEAVESVIHNHITFEDSLISKRPNHFDEYPSDYVNFTLTALMVISFPFLDGNPTS